MGYRPSHFQTFFQLDNRSLIRSTRVSYRRHSKPLVEYRGSGNLDLIQRSALGLVSVYNMLPQAVIDTTSLKHFQHLLQQMVKIAAQQSHPLWQSLLSPRLPVVGHPILSINV